MIPETFCSINQILRGNQLNTPGSMSSRRLPKGPFSATCPTRVLLDQIGDKWSILIMLALWEQPVRFNELKRTIEGISQKVLGHTLRNLERNGLVDRQVLSVKPIAVAYGITSHGKELAEIVEQLRDWSIRTMSKTAMAQARYDAKMADLSKYENSEY